LALSDYNFFHAGQEKNQGIQKWPKKNILQILAPNAGFTGIS